MNKQHHHEVSFTCTVQSSIHTLTPTHTSWHLLYEFRGQRQKSLNDHMKQLDILKWNLSTSVELFSTPQCQCNEEPAMRVQYNNISAIEFQHRECVHNCSHSLRSYELPRRQNIMNYNGNIYLYIFVTLHRFGIIQIGWSQISFRNSHWLCPGTCMNVTTSNRKGKRPRGNCVHTLKGWNHPSVRTIPFEWTWRGLHLLLCLVHFPESRGVAHKCNAHFKTL